MTSFVQGVSEPEPKKITTHGPFNPNPPDGEATLDIQYLTSIGKNGTTGFWTLRGWIMDFAQDLLNEAKPTLVNTMSWASPERQEGWDYDSRTDNEMMKLGLRGVTMVCARVCSC
jgi:hypothetical protein